jgi:hypothetical protein
MTPSAKRAVDLGLVIALVVAIALLFALFGDRLTPQAMRDFCRGSLWWSDSAAEVCGEPGQQ